MEAVGAIHRPKNGRRKSIGKP